MISTTVDIQICMSLEDIREAPNKNMEMQILKTYIIRGWPHTKDEVEPGVDRYWPVRHKLPVIDAAAMKASI